ncbi:transposase [Calderihabitans maritimus]|uniref:Transposase n=1 Tax=Calderihabitans maritimus TaxID=1246530 RepID=A0A1Z5HT43_9FIRM|nr:transposase [Calderihabitans maritimus]GAW92440.1 transposase [Calderihabitans maritimus]
MSDIKTPNKRKRWTAQAKMEIVVEGLKGQETVAELCRRVGITRSLKNPATVETVGLQRLPDFD